MKIQISKKPTALVLVQIILLISASVAFSILLSGYVGVVSAARYYYDYTTGTAKLYDPSSIPPGDTPRLFDSAESAMAFRTAAADTGGGVALVPTAIGLASPASALILNGGNGAKTAGQIIATAGQPVDLGGGKFVDVWRTNLPGATTQTPVYLVQKDGTTYISQGVKADSPLFNVGDKLSIGDPAGKTLGQIGAVRTPAELATAEQAKNAAYFDQHPIKGIFLGKAAPSMPWLGPMIAGLAWGITLYAGVKLVGGMFGLDSKLSDALANALFAGSVAGGIAGGIANQMATSQGLSKISGLTPGQWGFAIGAAVTIAVFLLTAKDERKEAINFQCLPWEAPIGGKDCEKCNQDPFRPCSEYRCKSLGQACVLENAGTLDELCVWKNQNDVTSPVIFPVEELLSPSGLAFIPDNAIRPPNRGVIIARSGVQNGCLQAFTPLQFGIGTDEPSRCKLDFTRSELLGQEGFDDMQFYVGDTNQISYNHTQRMSLPAPDITGTSGVGGPGPVIGAGGIYSLYVKCMDVNGNVNEDDFLVSFCVDPSPDVTPPIILDSSINDGAPVQYNIQETPIQLFVNEPAECKWSSLDKSYEDMENIMSCATQGYELNSQLSYTCSGTLTGIRNNVANDFFFKCKDKPNAPDNERNTMLQSYPLTLFGSVPLEITDAGPEGTIFGDSAITIVTLTAETSAGSDNGDAVCLFSTTGEDADYVEMINSQSSEHSQELDLAQGDYVYFIRCVDNGGNTAETTISFGVEIDTSLPQVTRAYRSGSSLRIVTDEAAECFYTTSNCNYETDARAGSGVSAFSSDSTSTIHSTSWQEQKKYYVKCRDIFGNEPSGSACSIVLSSVDLNPEVRAP